MVRAVMNGRIEIADHFFPRAVVLSCYSAVVRTECLVGAANSCHLLNFGAPCLAIAGLRSKNNLESERGPQTPRSRQRLASKKEAGEQAPHGDNLGHSCDSLRLLGVLA